MHELEAKLKVDSHAPVRKHLGDVGALFVSRGLETNWIYDRPDGSLRGQGIGLRVRVFQVESGDHKPATLTVKGPRKPGPFKSREEQEITVGDAATACRMLEMLGFVVVLEYQKRRESWRLDRCLVELDEAPAIGSFVEIEGPDEGSIQSVRERIGLASAPLVPESYVQLLAAHCDALGLEARKLLFEGK